MTAWWRCRWLLREFIDLNELYLHLKASHPTSSSTAHSPRPGEAAAAGPTATPPLPSPSPATALGPETLSIDYPRVCELARAAARGGEVVVQRREKVEKRPFLGLIERGLFVDRYSK